MRPHQPDPTAKFAPGPRRACVARAAFSVAELVVVIGIIVILAALVLSGVSRVRQSAQAARCLANLHNISVAFHAYATESDLRYPDPASTTISWESILQPYLGQTMVFACPSDFEVFPATGSSYDWRDTRDPATTLAGKRLSVAFRGDAVVAFETLPGWHAKHMMNAALVDGSCLTMPEDSCLGDLRLPLAPSPPQGAGSRPH